MTSERPYPRTNRLSEQVREVLAWEVERLRDPRIGFVTITGVEVTSDLHRATVFYSVLGDEHERSATRAGLRSASPYLRRALGVQVRMKYIPELVFEEDPAIQSGMRVEEILRDIHRAESPDE
jgi:ribosome-binding factor A